MAIKQADLHCIRNCMLLMVFLQGVLRRLGTQQKQKCICIKVIIQLNCQDGEMREWEIGRQDGTVMKYGTMENVWLQRAFIFIELIERK